MCKLVIFFYEITSCIFAEMVPIIGCYFLKMSTLFIWGFVSSQPLIAISVKKKNNKKRGGRGDNVKILVQLSKK